MFTDRLKTKSLLLRQGKMRWLNRASGLSISVVFSFCSSICNQESTSNHVHYWDGKQGHGSCIFISILKDSHRASCVYDFSQPFEPYVETCTSFYLSFGPKKLVNRWQAGSSVKTLILLLPRSSRSHRQTPPHQKPWDTVSLRCKSWFGLSRRLWWATDSFWNE